MVNFTWLINAIKFVMDGSTTTLAKDGVTVTKENNTVKVTIPVKG